jgi:formyl-CoA transferase
MQQFAMTGEAAPPMPARISPWGVYDVFTLAEGEQLFIGAVSDKQFVTLCELLGRPDLSAEPRFATNARRVAVRAELLECLGALLASHRVEDLAPRLEASDIPYAPIVRPEQLFDDPHLRASGGLAPMQTEDGGTTDVALLPLAMGGRRLGVRRALARIGEHTQEVLSRLKAIV